MTIANKFQCHHHSFCSIKQAPKRIARKSKKTGKKVAPKQKGTKKKAPKKTAPKAKKAKGAKKKAAPKVHFPLDCFVFR